MRVYQLAKELGFSSKELVEQLKTLNVEVKGHMSVISEETAEIVKQKLLIEDSANKDSAAVATTKKKTVKKQKETLKNEKILNLDIPITVKELSVRLKIKPNELIKHLMQKNLFATINQSLEEESVKEIVADYGWTFEKKLTSEEELLETHNLKDPPKSLKLKAPVVTMMGHVDHGKTSLLDLIRRTNVTAGEAGGITQHIGAYDIKVNDKSVTFLDTPGHEAFSAMRARGANVTDVVVLVVAADDGIMPQTVEAIDHAKAAGVPIIVAINKCDLPSANVDRVKQQLGEYELLPEDWGGKTITVSVSAKTGEGINNLLEMLLLEAEMLELKANPDRPANGVVLEGKLSKDKGPTAHILISNGTLRTGDIIISGLYHGKIKAMFNDKGETIEEAPPSKPAEVLGLSGIPEAGDKFFVIEDEKKAKAMSLAKQGKAKIEGRRKITHIRLEDLYQNIQQGQMKELKIIVKADVQGSLEVLLDSLKSIPTDEVRLSLIHSGIGDVNTSDVMLASASNAIIIGFHIGIQPKAQAVLNREEVELRKYDVIYKLTEDIRAALEGMLEPEVRETVLAEAVVQQIFKVSKSGIIAGSIVNSGKAVRTAFARIIREGEKIYEGKIAGLKRFKDDVKEVSAGMECGISLENTQDIKEGDIIEVFTKEEIARKLK